MSRNIQILIFTLLFLGHFLIPQLRAEETGEALSQKEALSVAYEHNPKMVEARKAIDVSKGDLITTRTWQNPEVEAEIGGLKKNEEGERNANLDSITFKQNFDPPGVRHLNTKIAKNDIRVQEEILKSVWSEIYVEVRNTYSKIILGKKELELKRNNLKSMRQFFSNVQLRYQSGQVLKNHLQRAKIELLKAESDYLKTENELGLTKAKLNLLLGRSRETLFDIKEELEEEKLTLNFEDLRQKALKDRPDVQIENLELDSRNKNFTKEQLNRLPSYSLGFQKVNEEYEKDYAAIFEVSIPLWNLNQGEVKKAKAQRDIQKVRFEAIKNDIEFEVYSLYEQAQLEIKQIRLFKESLEEANEMFRLAGLSYREGDIGFIDYLDQVRASMDSRMQYYQGLYTLNQTISALEKAIYGSVRQEDFLK